MSERAVRYAEEFSWRNQALKHFELAEQLCRLRVLRLAPTSPLFTASGVTEKEHSII